MLSRDGRPTPLGDAIAHYGRIAKTLHILRLADEPGYRRQIKVQANLQEGRHSLARKIFHGRSGQLYQRYQDGMEDQLGAPGLVLNALVLFTTRYTDAAVNAHGRLRRPRRGRGPPLAIRAAPHQHSSWAATCSTSPPPAPPRACGPCATRTRSSPTRGTRTDPRVPAALRPRAGSGRAAAPRLVVLCDIP
ncbi:Tn3 family transposase [Streptomyces antibioticus]|uniref:Tn3 family transposase n=1 Tax=Streptomyces antibioticus TaxID=1890 RepID=UPI003F4D2BA4